jgi:glutamine phosphoribosylpyrophosphate amidotransferase
VRGLHNLGKEIHLSMNAGIYHARYCTSGGDHQPVYGAYKSLVFNGVIDMGTKEEMEQRHEVDMKTDNDAELALLVPSKMDTDYIDALIKFIDNPKITFAGLIIDDNTKQLIAIRNSGRPLWMYQDIDCVYLASTLDIFKRAGVNIMYAEKLEPLKAYTWHI